jgi:prefoldin subunit 5
VWVAASNSWELKGDTDKAMEEVDKTLKDLHEELDAMEQDIHREAPTAGMRLSIAA